jgi:5-methylcytosine-specific restriction protein A
MRKHGFEYEAAMDLEKMRSVEDRNGIAGKVCSRCGQWKPLTEFNKKVRFVHSRCKLCLRELYAAAPKKDKREYYRAYNAANRDHRQAYRDANREHIRELLRVYRRDHQEKVRAAKRKWANNNRAKASEAHRRWRRNNPDKVLQNDHRRRARVRNAKGKFTLDEWLALKRAYEYTCLACRRQEPEIKLVPDHVVPIARGGANDIDNIQPLCEICNKRESTRTIDYRDGRDWRVELD